MKNLEYLFAGYSIVWVCTLAYLLFLASRQRWLARRLAALEERSRGTDAT